MESAAAGGVTVEAAYAVADADLAAPELLSGAVLLVAVCLSTPLHSIEPAPLQHQSEGETQNSGQQEQGLMGCSGEQA